MNIITDSHYLIGKSHLTCDDYAIHGDNYIMIADGCSGSKQSELGARLNALAFRSLLKEFRESFDYEEFGNAMAIRVNAYRIMLGLESECTDATAVGAYIDENSKVNIFMYGDGVFFYKFKTMDEVFFVTASYKDETPYYLSYWWDGARRKMYEEYAARHLDFPVIVTESELLAGISQVTEQSYKAKISTQLASPNGLQFIGVASDGLSSFIKTHDNGTTEKVSLSDIMRIIVDFSPINRNLVKRTLKKTRDLLSKERTHNSDDISLAVMYFKD